MSTAKTIVRALTESFWEEARDLCAEHPELAKYVDPSTQGTPLHVACSLGSAQINSDAAKGVDAGRAAVSCVKLLIDECPAAASHRDKHDHVPLEGIFSGVCAGRGDVGSFRFRTEAAGMLLERDPDSRLLLRRGRQGRPCRRCGFSPSVIARNDAKSPEQRQLVHFRRQRL